MIPARSFRSLILKESSSLLAKEERIEIAKFCDVNSYEKLTVLTVEVTSRLSDPIGSEKPILIVDKVFKSNTFATSGEIVVILGGPA